MKMVDMICVIELIDTMKEFREVMKVVTGSCYSSNTFVVKMDKLYRLVENNLHDTFNIDNKRSYEEIFRIVDDNKYSVEERARYVLKGTM